MKITRYFEKALYEDIIPDAASGRIFTNVTYDIGFNTTIIEDGVETKYFEIENQPTLIINNVELFNNTLGEYLKLASSFRDDQTYESLDIKEKTIIALLWANATSEDFKNPIPFMRKFINFYKDQSFNKFDEYTTIGYSDMLDCNIEIKRTMEKAFFETPYSMNVRLSSDYDGNSQLYFDLPLVRYGIDGAKGYIYAIQQGKKTQPTGDDDYNVALAKFQKRINRALYKVNDGFKEVTDGTDNIANPDNLTGITPSTLLASTIMMGLFNREDISNIVIPCYLPIRSQEKDVEYRMKAMFLSYHEREAAKLKFADEKDLLMRNIVDKFIRTFRRLDYHFDNIMINNFPYEIDDNMHISIGDNAICNNELLDQVYTIASTKTKKR